MTEPLRNKSSLKACASAPHVCQVWTFLIGLRAEVSCRTWWVRAEVGLPPEAAEGWVAQLPVDLSDQELSRDSSTPTCARFEKQGSAESWFIPPWRLLIPPPTIPRLPSPLFFAALLECWDPHVRKYPLLLEVSVFWKKSIPIIILI